MIRRTRTPSGVRAVQAWPTVFCTAALAALIPATAAEAGCSTSSGGFTLTCTGEVTGPQEIIKLGTAGSHTYTFAFEKLTSTSISSPTFATIEFQGSSKSFTNGTAGDDGPGLVFELNLDSAVADFQVIGGLFGGLVLFTEAGSGGTNGEKSGSGTQRGSNGGAGGYGGETTISITDTTITGKGSQPVSITTNGGNGGGGAEGRSTGLGDGFGGVGGAGGGVSPTVINLTGVSLEGTNGSLPPALQVVKQGGKGGTGGTGKAADYTGQGGEGGIGGVGGTLTVNVAEGLSITGADAQGIFLLSEGGDGGHGGLGENTLTGSAKGGSGGTGGNGSHVIFQSTDDSAITITTAGSALVAQSLAGQGGDGGNASSGGSANGGTGGKGGNGRPIIISLPDNAVTIETTGPDAQGIFARSYGGAGGDGGAANGIFGPARGGAAAGSGPGEDVSVTFNGSVKTGGDQSNAVIAQSVGGFDGEAGSATGFVAYGAGAQSAGAGGGVAVTWTGDDASKLSTEGDNADGIFAQSQGGGGGKGSSGSGIVAISGSGSAGGDGGAVTVNTEGAAIKTTGARSRAVFAQSVGGGGGDGGSASGLFAIGGTGSGGGTGGAVTVSNEAVLNTSGDDAGGIFAQSVGGGGGAGSSTSAITAIGGKAGSGATGGTVAVTDLADISTAGDNADGIVAQSVGGSGGHGGSAFAAGSSVSLAIGGAGGTGGNGGAVTIDDVLGGSQPTIATTGDTSRGVVAQSVGGGGGHGGNAISVSAGIVVDVAVALGGSGGAAGDGGDVTNNFAGKITTEGDHSVGLTATSTGGGGGSAGTTVAVASSIGVSLSAAVGGDGSGGGKGGAVEICRTDCPDLAVTGPAGLKITTEGDAAHGVLAASTGGGGGHSGVTVAGSAVGLDDIDVGVGGDGGTGGTGGAVTVWSAGGIETSGDAALGILAQSTGGSGGASYLTAAASTVDAGAVNVAVGGKGGSAGGSGAVSVTSSDTIATAGSSSDAVSALSVAGSGGAGGAVVAANGISAGNIGVAIGGDGGGGGVAGDVTIDWSGAGITTGGTQSAGLNAASIGGSGGRGGFDVDGAVASAVSIDVSLGGAGGDGGTAGKVTVESDGAITTGGTQSPAISAASIAGTGGRGGASISSTLVSQGDVAVTLGGGGGKGGTAKAVSVDNAGEIETRTTQSAGIFALSLGGSGGAGGFVAEGGITVTADPEVPAGNLAVSIGGAGGTGGTSGTVGVTSTGAITTDDFGSVGVSAQSIGGDGGSGGAVYSGVVNIAASKTVDIGVSVGGSGGGGGASDAVTVTNGAAITTKGHDSSAVLAQSIGGSGGNGGASYSIVMNLASGGEGSHRFDVTVGGSGGSGAIGDAVTVSNSAAISTGGTTSFGVFAQSVGGGGGAGGAGGTILANLGEPSGSAEKTTNFQVAIGVGGNGGTGADSAKVTVSNAADGSIMTAGPTAPGIFAQSVGGGGGHGGSAPAYSFEFEGKCSLKQSSHIFHECKNAAGSKSTTTYSASVEVGGNGGAAGDGEVVEVTNDGAIATKGQVSHAVFAQSVGGGGGTGGDGTAGLGGFTSNATANDINDYKEKITSDPSSGLTSYTHLGLAIGGAGGASGTGAAVTVANNGTITTAGQSAHGILGQSVGGGGGTGGAAAAAPTYSLNIGGSGKAGGNAGSVTVDGGSGSGIGVTGAGSFGILAQSVGGGGGATGSKSRILDTSGIVPSLDLTVGGSDGAAGDGGTVTVRNAATTITTGGRAGIGIFGQSIGGGGGLAVDGVDGADGSIAVGDGTSSGTSAKPSGDGGAITVSHDGAISTSATPDATPSFAAHAIAVQSVGGSGGYAGAVVMGSTGNFGAGLSGLGSGTGDGGDVTVTATGDITTAGASSIGIFAQSVGGGGGVAGNTDNTATSGAFIGSGGGTGTGGTVSVTYGDADGPATVLKTTGAGAHGIFAQSVGGDGSSTVGDPAVTVTVNQAIEATGAGAFGVFAQSAGDGMGAIEIDVAETGSITGGGAATIADADDGAGVFVNGGTSSTLTNAGTITSVLGTAGVAINAEGTDLTVDNTGTITGQILKASSVTVLNRAAGVVDAGALLDVDHFTNEGTLAIGTGAIGATELTGDLVQTASGTLVIDLDPSQAVPAARTDRLTVDGDATLDGRIAVNLLDDFQFVAGPQTLPLLSVAGTLSDPDLELATASAVAQYRLETPAAGGIGLSYDIDFANPEILAATNDNQDDLAGYLHRVYRAGALDDDLASALIEIEDETAYARVMNTLGAEVAVDNQITSLLSGIRFGDALLSCAARTGQYRFLDDGRCGWMQIGGTRFNRQSTGDNLGFDAAGWQLAGGAQFDIGDDWSFGVAVGYERRSLGVDDSDASSDGSQFQFGLSAKRSFGATEVSGSLALGHGRFDIDREPLPGVSLDGDQRLWLVSGQIRAARSIELGNWSLKPRVDLGVDYLSMGDFSYSGTGTGAGGLRVDVDESDDVYVHVQGAVDIATEFEATADVLVRPRLSVGITQFIGDAAPAVTGRMAAAPADAGSFTTSSELDRTRFDLVAGLDIFDNDAMVIRAEAFAGLSKHTTDYGGTLRIEIPF